MTIRTRQAALAVAVAAAFLGGYGLHERMGIGAQAAVPIVAAESAATHSTASVSPPDFSTIASEQGPAVVNISVTGKIQQTAMSGGQPGMDALLASLGLPNVAVPEPATIVIWSLLGGFGLVFAWRKRK